MDTTQRYTTRNNRLWRICLTYNERIRGTDNGRAFVQNVDVLDAETREPISVPSITAQFSTYEQFQSFGGYAAINYMGDRNTAIEGLRQKVLTRIEDALERLG